MDLLCKPILLAGRGMGRRTHIRHCTLRGMISSRPATARSCHGAVYNKDLEELFLGNNVYKDDLLAHHSTLLERLAKEGQRPPFAMFQCSDSRLNEQATFHTKPGTIFTTRNIANVFTEDDVTSTSVLGYAVETLKVRHVIVMGHYGCGGIAASMVPPPPTTLSPADAALSTWILPIRKLFATSTRPEIVAYRQGLSDRTIKPKIPKLQDPAFRALVEENVKMSVQRIAASKIIRKNYSAFTSDSIPVFIHGWVQGTENGVVSDLGVSVGPSGVPIPKSPFPSLGR